MRKLLSTTVLVTLMGFSSLAYAQNEGHGKEGHEGPPPFMEEALSKLPEKDANSFRDTMKKAHEKDHALHEQMHKLHDELHEMMIADDFDKKAFIAKSNELEKLHHKMHTSMTEGFATALSRLPADERKTLADSMRDHHRPDGDKPAPASD